MRISDWSSDVCSSDLHARPALARGRRAGGPGVPRLRRLTIIVAAADGARLYAAIEAAMAAAAPGHGALLFLQGGAAARSEEPTSELQSPLRLSYADLSL